MLPPALLMLLLAQLLPTTQGPIPAGADLAEAPPASDGSKSASAACATPDPKEDCGSCAVHYQLWQPCLVGGRARESATLPCTFDHGWAATRELGVSWRVGSFHSRTFLLNATADGARSVHANFSGRAFLAGDLRGRREASVRILDLREEDANLYFCRVFLRTADRGPKEWQALRGTRLTVAAGAAPQPAPRDLLAPLLGAAGLLTAVTLLGLAVFLARRRGAGRRAPPDRRTAGETGEKEKPGEEAAYEEVGAKGARAPAATPGPPPGPSPSPEESGLLYAALALREAEDEAPRPVGLPGRPGPETTYAVLRH